MNKGSVYIVGEDPVTVEIIKRVVHDYTPYVRIVSVLPARGSELKSKIPMFNKLAQTTPVVLLSDLDTEDCAPKAKNSLLNAVGNLSDNFIVNIAVDEAEAWLYADREGLATYLNIDKNKMPVSKTFYFGGPKERQEMDTPCKTSFHLTHFLMKDSKDVEKQKQLYVEGNSKCKGKEYNSALIPFIKEKWNIEAARLNSYSLDGMIRRVVKLNSL